MNLKHSPVSSSSSTYNFSAGPAKLPDPVMKKYSELLYRTPYSGCSWLEIGHRLPAFQQVVKELELTLRELLAVPDNYRIFFPPCGGRAVSAMVALNLMARTDFGAAYVDTGLWSQLAFEEAKRQGQASEVASAKALRYTSIPEISADIIGKDYSYVHIVDNETAHGLRYPEAPNHLSAPLVSDMTSCLFTELIDVSQYGLIYAAAQKNLGSAGMSVVIVREDLIGHALPHTPSMLDFSHYCQDPTPVTPDMMAMVLALEVAKWHLDKGIDYFARQHQTWAAEVYQALDASSVFYAPVHEGCRSRNNMIFYPYEHDQDFAREAEIQGLFGLKGHRTVGGLRASLYNAMTQEGVSTLIKWIQSYG